MNQDLKTVVANINKKIEAWGLTKILVLLSAFWIGVIAYSTTKPIIAYDCSDKAAEVSKMVLACEQQKIDEKIKIKEIELAKFKAEKDYEIAELKAYLQSIDYKDPKSALKKLKSSMEKSMLSLEKINDSCLDKMVESMCMVVKK